jgi:hypothetical protein
MAGRRDRDGNGPLPGVLAHRAQVDCACPPPVDGVLGNHCMVDGGLIHIDGVGGQLIPIVDNGNNLLEGTVCLIAHFLQGALRGVRGHAVDEAVFCHKARNDSFWAERVLLAKTGLKLEAFLMRHRHETSIPFPRHSSTKETSSSM